VGQETFRIARDVIDEIVVVDTDEICAAIQDIFEDTRSIVEPSGALAVAAVKRYSQCRERVNETYVTINCGANMNFDRLRHVSERAEFGQHREALYAVELAEKPGSFLKFAETLGPRSVTEFNYRTQGGAKAHVFVGLALRHGNEERQEIAKHWQSQGLNFVDMTESEMAKLHVRYLIGGNAPQLSDERLFRFEFPERPGALLKFLRAVGNQWNISLFHYRNHGSDYGRVLVGIEVPSASSAEFQMHLDQLNFAYWEETENPAYRIFLRQ
jgi:threonine dehydratase